MSSVEKIVQSLSSLTVPELLELSKTLEEKWGVSAAMVATPAVATVSPAVAVEAEPEKIEFDVILVSVGDRKIEVIKEVKAITSLGLKEAKDLVDGAPKPVKTSISKVDAESIKSKLEKAGATIEIK